MRVSVFVQNEAGSDRKNYHDEKTLEYKSTRIVSRAYPYPYGFLIGTTARDGCNVDCFVITDKPLKTCQTIECEAVDLMEQIEDGAEDHNVLAVPVGEATRITPEIEQRLTEFVMAVFAHVPGKRMHVGSFLGPECAAAHIASHLDTDAKTS